MNAMSCANRVPPTSVMQILCRAVMPVQRFEFLELQLTLLCFSESLELQVNWYYFAQFFRPCCSRLMLKSCGVLLKADFYALFLPPLADFYRYRPSLLKRCLKFLRWKNLFTLRIPYHHAPCHTLISVTKSYADDIAWVPFPFTCREDLHRTFDIKKTDHFGPTNRFEELTSHFRRYDLLPSAIIVPYKQAPWHSLGGRRETDGTKLA